MKNLTVLAAAGLLLMVSSCGSSLTSEQKGVFFSTVENANKTSNSLAKVSSKSSGKELTSNMKSTSVQIKELSTKLEDKFDEDKCTVKSEESSNTFSVSGSDCPITFNVTGSMNQSTANSGSVSVKMAFAITDSELLAMEEVRVTEGAFNMNMSVSGSESSANVKGDFGGHLLTKDYGRVIIGGNIDISADQGGASGSALITYAFPEFTAELEIDASNREITLNGEKLTQEDLNRLGSFGPSQL